MFGRKISFSQISSNVFFFFSFYRLIKQLITYVFEKEELRDKKSSIWVPWCQFWILRHLKKMILFSQQPLSPSNVTSGLQSQVFLSILLAAAALGKLLSSL